MTQAGESGHRGRSFLSRFALEVLIVFAGAILIAFVLKLVVAQAFFIPSASMTPQLEVSDRVLVSKLSYRLHEPRRGDIVVFDCPPGHCHPGDEGDGIGALARWFAEGLGVVQPSPEELIKRVVALPGETVEARDGEVYVDGRRLIEPYLPPGTVTANLAPTTVPGGHLYVLGDNRSNSTDSRVFGPIRRDLVVGRAIATIWPPTDASFL